MFYVPMVFQGDTLLSQVNLYLKYSKETQLLVSTETVLVEIQSILVPLIKFLMIITQWELVVDNAKFILPTLISVKYQTKCPPRKRLFLKKLQVLMMRIVD